MIIEPPIGLGLSLVIVMRLAKETLNAIEDKSLRDGYRYEQNMTVQLRDHPDSKEAAAAFFEKRPAKYSE